MFEFRLRFSLKLVPEVRINNIPALVQQMDWHLPGANPLFESVMASFRFMRTIDG